MPALRAHPEAVLALVREVPRQLVQAPGKGRQRPSRLVRQQEAPGCQLLGDVGQAHCKAKVLTSNPNLRRFVLKRKSRQRAMMFARPTAKSNSNLNLNLRHFVSKKKFGSGPRRHRLSHDVGQAHCIANFFKNQMTKFQSQAAASHRAPLWSRPAEHICV